MADNNADALERVIAGANQKDVALIADGLTKQHFIELEEYTKAEGNLYEAQIKHDEWLPPPPQSQVQNESIVIESNTNEDDEANDIFSTEVNDRLLNEARSRLASRLSGVSASISSVSRQLRASLVETMPTLRAGSFAGIIEATLTGVPGSDSSGLITKEPTLPRWYLNETAKKIKDELANRGGEHYDRALNSFKNAEYGKALVHLNKAFLFNSLNIQFYLLRYEIFIILKDYKAALLTINKLMAILSIYTDDSDSSYDELRQSLLEKTVSCFSSIAEACFESGQFMDAYESYNKAGELKPDIFDFKVKSISCLCEMNRTKEAIDILTQLIDENEESKRDAKLYIVRANVYLKENETSKAYFDVKQAIALDAENEEAQKLMTDLKEKAESLRNNGVILGLNSRLLDGINKLSEAILYHPEKAEFHLQRGILFKRRKDFNSAIDDFLLGIEKLNKEEKIEPEDKQEMVANFQRQILLTYNDFSIQCFEKGFYDDAIVLLNKAIKIEKTEKGFYVNRGDCFYRKNERKYALLDYEQANEIDPKDEQIKNRIAKIQNEFAIEKYNEKEYEEATRYFDKAIEFAPKNCKYYISRARTLFFTGEKLKAQIDICVAILLDPSNHEIPGIISRIFVNNDLNEVMNSEQMKFAKSYLEELNIASVFDLSKLREKTEKEEMAKRLDRPNKLQPSLKEAKKEEREIMKIIEEKKKIKGMIKEVENRPIKEPVRFKLTPSKEKFDIEKRNISKEINWRRFDSGIGSSSI